ncbi:sensor histidine kinase [Vibrio sp. 10N.222.52.C3]|uniref:sensor histidine kinase n=1 Tax=Vibrio sp. 10N.222.52.C3 TaxID=3229631 RepID=UPI00354E5AD6
MIDVLKEILNSDSFSKNLSLAINNKPLDSHRKNECDLCTSCPEKTCIVGKSQEHICDKGLTTYSMPLAGHVITAYGYTNDRSIVSKNKKLKNSLKGRSMKREHFYTGMYMLTNLVKSIEGYQLKKSSEVLHYFHDVSKWGTSIENASVKIIEKQQGNSFNENFSSASSDLKAIYQSSKLLTDTINMIEVYFNPESAKFEGKRRVEVYKLFDKIQSILFHTVGKKFNKRFRLVGTLYRDIDAYESFQIIPLSLLQNALKYSKENEIEILLEEGRDGIHVRVESIGPIIEDFELKKIFKKNYRGKYARKMNHDGMGIGLYVSQIIAEAHGFEIKVNSQPLNYQVDSIPLAKNCFYFVIPI